MLWEEVQENLFSKRIIYFLQDCVFWQCQADVWDEGTALEPCHTVNVTERHFSPNASGLDLLKLDAESPLACFWSILGQYQKRQFNPQHEYDVVNAFQGVIQRISAISGELFHWGLSQSDFERSLAWRQSLGQLRRRRCKLPSYGNDGTTHALCIPSWSWMGWEGETHWSPIENNVLGNPRSECMRDVSLKWAKVGLKGHAASLMQPLKHKAYSDLVRPPWKGQVVLAAPSPCSDFKDSGLIQTFTCCATMSIQSRQAISYKYQGYIAQLAWEYSILDAEGNSVGSIYR